MPQIAQQDYIRIDWGGASLVSAPSDNAKEKILQCIENGTVFDVIASATNEESKILGFSHGAKRTITVFSTQDDNYYRWELE